MRKTVFVGQFCYCFILFTVFLWIWTFTVIVLQVHVDDRSEERVKGMALTGAERSGDLQRVSDVLYQSIHRIQNPDNCRAAKKLICSVNHHPLGFNNMMHMLVTCHLMAYGLGRVLLVTNMDFWSQSGDLQKWFRPAVPFECGFKRNLKIDDFKHVKHVAHPENRMDFETIKNGAKLLKYEFDFSGIKAPFPYPPGVMPRNLLKVVKKLHRNPVHWYIGHFFKYHLYRPNANFTRLLTNVKKDIGFVHPIVGIHVRQGDKVGDEMNFIPEDFFIAKTRNYFMKNCIHGKDRRIFVATDTPKVVDYFKKTYSHEFTIVHVKAVDRHSAGSYYTSHYKGDHLTALLVEMTLLIEADFNVVTFSSYLGKVVYLARQAISQHDASDLVLSMDRRWFFTAPGYQYGPEFGRYCLFVKNGTSLLFPSMSKNFYYQEGDYGKLHSREQVMLFQGRKVKGIFVTHVKSKETGIVVTQDIVNYPRQPDFIEDHVFDNLM